MAFDDGMGNPLFEGDMGMEDFTFDDEYEINGLLDSEDLDLLAAQSEGDDYFANFPHDEALVRRVLEALKDCGLYNRKKFNPLKCDLSDILVPPENLKGLKIVNLTEGPDYHEVIHPVASLDKGYDVPENEVFATFDKYEGLKGIVETYRLQKKEGELELIERCLYKKYA